MLIFNNVKKSNLQGSVFTLASVPTELYTTPYNTSSLSFKRIVLFCSILFSYPRIEVKSWQCFNSPNEMFGTEFTLPLLLQPTLPETVSPNPEMPD